MKSSNATTTVYSKAASLLWLQGSKELPAAARVRGLNSAARAGLGNFQEKKPEADHADQPRFFQKEVIWAETSFSGDRLPNSKDHSWRSNFGKPEISITRCILLSLLIGILRTDYLPDISVKEYFLLRAPFSLHSGWIIAASALNTNVVADYYRTSDTGLLMLAMVSLCTIAVLVALFALAAPRADPIIPLVACWALLGIFNELGNPENLMNDAKWNFIDWPHWVLEAVRQTALVLSVASAVGAAVAIVRILLSLLIGILRTDYLPDISVKEYFLLRAPFSLHSGWIIAASALNTNVVADYYRTSDTGLLMLAMVSLCTIAVLVALFALAAPRADPIIALVACWALLGIFVELSDPENLMNLGKFNFIDWPDLIINAVQQTALVLSLASGSDLDDNSNPYVVCKVSGRQKLGFRTQTRFKSLDPVQAMTWGTAEEAANAVASLDQILTSEGIRSRFVAAGIVQPLVSLLSDGSMDTRCKAAAALSNLGQCSVARSKVRLQAAFAISRIAGADDRRQVLIEAEMVQPLHRLLQQGKFDCKAEAANAIGELANATDRRLFKKIAMHLLESDILEPLLALWLRSSGGS
eukprot:g30243.t2